jgi:hypothetical protein
MSAVGFAIIVKGDGNKPAAEPLLRTEPGVLVDKSGNAVAAVQNRNQFHRAEGRSGEKPLA